MATRGYHVRGGMHTSARGPALKRTGRGLRRWFAVGIAACCFVVAACASTETGGGGGADDQPSGAGQPSAGGAGSGASTGGPITIDGVAAPGYDIGRCEIIDDVVYARARSSDVAGPFVGFELVLPAWDRDIAHGQRDGRISLSGQTDEGGIELVASRNDEGTTWDWTVSGSHVVVMARMANRTSATRNDDGTSTFTEYPEVTISIDCNGTFGPGTPETEPTQAEFNQVQPGLARVPGSVTIELEGTTYPITYLSTCQFYTDDVTAEGASDEANVFLASEGAGVDLVLSIGDMRDQKSLERWGLPADAAREKGDFQFEGSDTSRTWSGTIVSPDGRMAEATITVECTEGDSFDAAGTGTVILDGVTHVLDETTQCTIDGTAVDFYGRASDDPVAVVVTSGGSEILFADEAGKQSITRDVMFDVSGQQATWSGVLAGDRQATISIDCG